VVAVSFDCTATGADQDISFSVQCGAQDASGELLLRSSHLVVLWALQLDANHIAGGGSDIGVMIGGLNRNGAELSTHGTEVDIGGIDLTVRKVDVPDTEGVVSTSDELIASVVEEREAQRQLVGGGTTAKWASRGEIPNDKGVVILTSHAGQVLLVGAEGQGLNLDLVEHHAVDQLLGGKLKDADIGLESHVGDLTGGNIPTAVADREAANFVVVAPQERCRSRIANLADHDAGTKRIEQVLSIRMDVEPTGYGTAKPDGAFQGQVRGGFMRAGHFLECL
jgi:hypothetical protein